LLPAVEPQVLVEVALRVEQTNAHEWDPEIRRRLAVIAGQHAKATGVDRHGVVQPEFRAEVRDRPIDELGIMIPDPGSLTRALAIRFAHEPIVEREELRIACNGAEPLGMTAR